MIDKDSCLLASIRTALEASPPAIAESGTLRIHTLFSIPRQVKSLYPLAHIHPTDLEYNKRASPIGSLEEQIFVSASWSPTTTSPSSHSTSEESSSRDQEPNSSEKKNRKSEDKSAPLLALAMELYLYTIPELGSAVLYISKLDSSGWGPSSIPFPLRSTLSQTVFNSEKKLFSNTLTATLTSAITQHFSTFRHWNQNPSGLQVNHLSVHILARSQRAYLFPSSPENKNKNVLSDGGLIKWWRGVMSDVVVSTRDDSSPVRKGKGMGRMEEIDARGYYLIPGYSRLESHPLVPLIKDDPTSPSNNNNKPSTPDQILKAANWTYGHPYSPTGASCPPTLLPPLPLHWRTSSFIQSKNGEENDDEETVTDPNKPKYDPKRVRTVPTLMPHFGDDPKTRFLDEMARDAHEHSGWKKKLSNATRANSGEVSAPGVTKKERENGTEKEMVDVGHLQGETDAATAKAGEDGKHEEKNNKPEREEKQEGKGSKRTQDTVEDETKDSKRAKTDSQAQNEPSSSPTPTSTGVPMITIRALTREREAMDDLPIDEFWERMAFRQECCSGNAVGVLVILFTRFPPLTSALGSDEEVKKGGLERQPLSIPNKVLADLVFKSLMRDSCEWNKVTLSRTLTEAWFAGVDREIRRKGGVSQYFSTEPEPSSGEGKGEKTYIGKGLIWDDFELKGPTKEDLEKAQMAQKGVPENGTSSASGGGGATMLSVKRKKKPT